MSRRNLQGAQVAETLLGLVERLEAADRVEQSLDGRSSSRRPSCRHRSSTPRPTVVAYSAYYYDSMMTWWWRWPSRIVAADRRGGQVVRCSRRLRARRSTQQVLRRSRPGSLKRELDGCMWSTLTAHGPASGPTSRVEARSWRRSGTGQESRSRGPPGRGVGRGRPGSGCQARRRRDGCARRSVLRRTAGRTPRRRPGGGRDRCPRRPRRRPGLESPGHPASRSRGRSNVSRTWASTPSR